MTAFLVDKSKANEGRHVLLTGSRIHPVTYEKLAANQIPIYQFAKIYGLTLPKKPSFLRTWRMAKLLSQIHPSVLLMWDYAKDADAVNKARALGATVIYYDHGGCFGTDGKDKMSRVFAEVDGVICNSTAAQRVLQLEWGLDKPVIVCANALRPELCPGQIHKKKFPSDRPFRLGVAGRIEGGKGFSLVVRALKLLVDRGYDVELYLAGEGRQQPDLQGLAREMGVGEKCHFVGLVKDMAEFYKSIECCLVPSINESFGMVSIEAQAWGAVVIAAGIDGLVDTLADGKTGYLLRPELTLDRFPEFSHLANSACRYQYDPYHDMVTTDPKILDPDTIAQTIEKLLNDPASFESMSEAASCRIIKDFTFTRYVQNLSDAVRFIRGNCH